ncbi:MAG: rhomboid family intramembrane serine protease [Fimbriimonadales bacterium]|nr:rhomboid family intramembrane serine protease [Fimbriimonadales bacterium]
MKARIPYATLAIIIANLVVACFTIGVDRAEWSWGFIPSSPDWTKLFASMFAHTNPLHLLGNMVFLAAVGPAVEFAAGSLRMVIVYLAGGIIGGLVHYAMTTATQPSVAAVPMIGASAAIAGLIGYYWLRFYRKKVPLAPKFHVPVYVVVIVWLVLQLAGALMSQIQFYGPVAYWAHLGGFAGGFALALVFKAGKEAENEAWQSHLETASEIGPAAQAEAARAYLKRNPNDLPTLRNLSAALQILGDKHEEERVVMRVFEIDPSFDKAFAIDRLAVLNALRKIPQRKRLKAAQELADSNSRSAEVLLNSLGNHPDALAMLVDLFAVGDPERAKQYFKQLEIDHALSPQLEAAKSRWPQLSN